MAKDDGKTETRGRKRVQSMHRLSQQHFMVVEHYIQGCTRQEAMMKAGYAKTTAEKQAWRVFAREDVQNAIEERRWKLRTRSHGMVDRIKEELATIAFFNIGKLVEILEDGSFLFDFDEATLEDFAALGELTVESFKEGKGKDAVMVKRIKVKPYDKKGALDSLARIYGMFQDNMNVNVPGGSVEDRLAKGRQRVAGEKELSSPEVIEGELAE